MHAIPVCEPFLNGNEKKYLQECIDSGWISSSGKFINRFEEEFSNFCNSKYAVCVANGTLALHLALVSLGISKDDEVIVPNFTMIASAFAVCYCQAKPIFVDVDPLTWNIDVSLIENAITSKTKAIMVVSIFGNPCNMEVIRTIANKYNLFIIEDAAESHGAEYKGIKTGNLADITTFSFFANKNLTTGEGGMVVTNSDILYKNAKYYKNLCFPLEGPRNYVHEDIGFNYRMSNIHAAIGVAQIEKADYYINMRITNANLYKQYLEFVPGISFQKTENFSKHVHWMNSIIVNHDLYGRSKNELQEHLKDNGIETRNLFVGMNKQPSLIKYGIITTGNYINTEYLTNNGLYLPSSTNISIDSIQFICDVIKKFKK